MKRLHCSIRKDAYSFKIGLSDEGELLLEEGDLFSFLELVQPLIDSSLILRNASTKRLIIESNENIVEKGLIGSRSISLFEVLAFEVNASMTENWFDTAVKVFSEPVIGGEGIVNFVLEKGNPYFLANVIDTENGSAVYLSATKEEIRISPADEETNVATVSKVIRMLQRYVDPKVVPRMV
jgi:hypothetical protein